MHKSKKAFLDISFSWIFSLIVGAIILFGAIYAVDKVMEVKGQQSSGEAGMNLNAILSPLETGIESGNSMFLTLAVDSRLRNQCDDYGDFGKQRIAVEEKVYGKWTKSVNVSFENKYLFFPKIQEGKEFYVFSKPFEYPYKIANLMYLTNKNELFCFDGAPVNIKKELKAYEQPNFFFGNCPEYATKICFQRGEESCDIIVDEHSVIKNGDTVFYETDALMYAAIFSDREIYECEVARLIKRGKILSEIYRGKAINIMNENCQSAVSSDLKVLSDEFESYSGSGDLYQLNNLAMSIKSKNRQTGGCKLW